MNLLAHRSLPESTRPWYTRRVEEFLKGLHTESFSRLAAERVSG
ncbi:hypothetical protein [uncultured Thiodictyon sp.]|nr:hypothetical protein [uncultured Thiodictyon sp.]